MAHTDSSPFLKVLDTAGALAAKEQRGGSVRGAGPGPVHDAGGSATSPFPSSGAASIEAALATAEASISAQIASVRTYFRSHPDLLRLLDAGIRAEFQAIERRMRRYTLISNISFTVLGVILGLLVPVALAVVGIVLPTLGR
jgi:hypothetical protein